MDAQQKTQLEQKAVAALFVVFLVVFFCGPLKGLGLFRAKRPSTLSQSVDSGQLSVVSNGSVAVSTSRPTSLLPAEPQPMEWQEHERPQGPVARYTAQRLRDPLKSLLPSAPSVPEPERSQEAPADTALANAEAVGLSHLSVQGLWWGGPEPKAIINGRVYGLYETVEGARITSIGREGIELEMGGTTVQLTTAQGSSEAIRSQQWRSR